MDSTNTKANGDQSNQKFLQPKLYFIQKSIEVGGPLSEEKAMVSQLVRKGATLADFPTYQQMKKKGFVRSPIEAGENVEFAEKSYSLVATASGYPKVRYIEQKKGPSALVVTIIPAIKISHNKMQAHLVIHPALPDSPSLQTDNLNEIIKENGITHGIDHLAMSRAQQILTNSNADFDDIVIAKGIYPSEGTNARLQFEIEIGPLAGYELENGSIDFRDRRVMVGVKKNDLIATKFSAVPGKAGYNVLGDEIEPKTGKDIKVKVQGLARFDPEQNKVFATGDGALSIVNNDTIKVASKVTIPTDVNYATGNIESESNVVIRGTIHPEFTVEVGGDLEIHGAVSSASIRGGGNTVIKNGVTGTSSLVKSNGDVDVKFIERSTIKSGGIVVIRKQC